MLRLRSAQGWRILFFGKASLKENQLKIKIAIWMTTYEETEFSALHP